MMRNFFIFLFLFGCISNTAALSFVNEKLHYEIVFHWGIIWKHAASADLSLNVSDKWCDAELIAYTRSWADKIYSVRDTLKASFTRELRPLKYEKITHEEDFFEKDEVKYSYLPDGIVRGDCRTERKNCIADTTFFSRKPAYDMMSVFYLLRSLNFQKMRKGDPVDITVFSGRKMENLQIRYIGVERAELRYDKTLPAHHLIFRFTQDGKTKSSEDIDAWISADSQRIPLALRGRLPIGEVRVFLKMD